VSLQPLRDRLISRWEMKLGWSVIGSLIFTPAYVAISRVNFWHVDWAPTTWIDLQIHYSAGWFWIYQSIYLLTASAPWFAQTREEIRRLAAALVILAIVSMTLFLFLPVRLPGPPTGTQAVNRFWYFGTGYYGAMPSLHAGFLTVICTFHFRLFGWRSAFLWVWSVLILFATLRVKEHYFVDLPAGVIVGLLSDRLAWRSSRRAMPKATAANPMTD
jgi:membrane-associated phospholipid phosphatase